MIVTNTTRSKWLKNIFHLEWTFEKDCILFKKRINEDCVILEVFNQNELYFYLLIERFYIISKRILNDCYKYKKVKKLEEYISFWVNIWKVLHPDHPNEKWGSFDFGGVQSKRALFLPLNIPSLHNF